MTEGLFLVTLVTFQVVILFRRHNKICHFITDVMDYFLASEVYKFKFDLQPGSLTDQVSLASKEQQQNNQPNDQASCVNLSLLKAPKRS